jgi:hypothetical protein
LKSGVSGVWPRKEIDMHLKKIACFFIIWLPVIFGGCNFVSGFDNAKKVAELFLEDRFVNGGAGSDEFYSTVFWDNTDANEWQAIQKLVGLSLGDLQSYSLISWNIQNKIHSADLVGTFAVLVFETEYDKGSGHETLTLFKRSGRGEFEIVGHQIDSRQINDMVLKGIERAAEQNA